jgi:hypothetical protein
MPKDSRTYTQNEVTALLTNHLMMTEGREVDWVHIAYDPPTNHPTGPGNGLSITVYFK